ncbi:hypothetical protein FE782_13970 [Paenibacillus antri]|uniref:Uncharacterized protein n=1 Tax=Paenibacillus antri TaxID=2582848 RepID=A0A5R9GE39_9BACL|nr:hypothetical protein [Paenibacillus antri]TLS51608.1 hypothetical protein FE782_13970 [Paenibacillus antri]
MRSDKWMDRFGIASQVGLLISFGGALCIEMTGADEWRRWVGVCAAVSITAAAFAAIVYVRQIAKNKRAARTRQREGA